MCSYILRIANIVTNIHTDYKSEFGKIVNGEI